MRTERPSFPEWPAWIGLACFLLAGLFLYQQRPVPEPVATEWCQAGQELVSLTCGQDGVCVPRCAEAGSPVTSAWPVDSTSAPVVTGTTTDDDTSAGLTVRLDDGTGAPVVDGIQSGGSSKWEPVTWNAPLSCSPFLEMNEIALFYQCIWNEAKPAGPPADLLLGTAGGSVTLSKASEDRIVRRLQQWIDANEARALPAFGR